MWEKFDGISDLLISEQFFHMCAEEMALELMEEVVRLAEQNMETHDWTITGKATKSCQKQNTEHKTDPETDKKAQNL